jgi:hypothetical protein
MGALRQIVVTAEPQCVTLSRGITEIDILSRGGDLAVSVGEGPQDVEFDGTILPAGHSATLSVVGENPHIAVMLVSDGGIGMIQITER